MTLKYYIAKLQEINKLHPNATVIYSHDGQYYKVRVVPTEGEFKEDELGWETQFKTGLYSEPNSVCVN